jgi:RNA polymerase sigma-70 factor (ECF subfamily)
MAGVSQVPYEGVAPSDMRAALVELNGGPALVFTAPGRVVATLSFDFDDQGRILGIYNIANPDKLRAVARPEPS